MDSPLVGAWCLVAWRRVAADGSVAYPFGSDALGRLVYTADGFMAATVARAERPPFAAGDIGGGTVEERAAAAEDYIAYCGRYEFDGGTVTHHIELSLFPNWTGTDQARTVRLEGDQLTLRTPPILFGGAAMEHELDWERLARPAT